MKSARIRRSSLFTTLAIVALALVDRGAAWLLGSEPLLSAIGGAGDAALLAWAVGHCDSMDGPVLKLARKALETGNVNYVLPWVQPADEAQVRHAFEHVLKVRKLGEEARSLADTHFFETLVRVHRAGEGEPYTGIKPSGTDLGPAIPAADRALEDGSAEAVVRLIGEAVRHGVHERLHAAMSRKSFDVNDVAAGRRYVESYVPYVHYVEKLWETASEAGHTHAHHAAHAEPMYAH